MDINELPFVEIMYRNADIEHCHQDNLGPIYHKVDGFGDLEIIFGIPEKEGCFVATYHPFSNKIEIVLYDGTPEEVFSGTVKCNDYNYTMDNVPGWGLYAMEILHDLMNPKCPQGDVWHKYHQ